MIVNQQSLRGIYVGFNTLFNKAFEGSGTRSTTEVATVAPPSYSDSETYAWLGDIPGMREWIGDREIQNLTGARLHHQEQGLRAHRRRRPQRGRGRQDRPL